jgi:hypothetical protein
LQECSPFGNEIISRSTMQQIQKFNYSFDYCHTVWSPGAMDSVIGQNCLRHTLISHCRIFQTLHNWRHILIPQNWIASLESYYSVT